MLPARGGRWSARLGFAVAMVAALALAGPSEAARRRPLACTLDGGFIWLLVYSLPPNVSELLNVLQPLPTNQPGATQLFDLGPLEGEAALRFDCDPRLAGPELRLRNTTGSAIQGALVLGVPLPPTAGGTSGYAELEVAYTDSGGGGLSETVQYDSTLFTNPSDPNTATLVPGLRFSTAVSSENPLTFSAGPVPLPEPAQGTPYLELDTQLSFTLGPGDSLVLRSATSLAIAPPAVCADGFDNDGDGYTDVGADPGCAFADDGWEQALDLECDDGADNDGDGFRDYRMDGNGDGLPDPPGDPGCFGPTFIENPRCQDGIDNDAETGTDYDGGVSVLGAGNGDPNGPDPECTQPYLNKEAAPRCGLGVELGLLLPLLMGLRRRRRRRAARTVQTASG